MARGNRRLTVKQTQVLSAIERSGRTTVYDLGRELLWCSPSEVWRVVQALIKRGLVECEGDPAWVYAGTAETFRSAGYEPPKSLDPFFIWAKPRSA